MDFFLELINVTNDILWTYILIILLIGCAFWFTIKTRFVQFRMLGEMFRVLGNSANTGQKEGKHISSFQAFVVSLASRIGTGNLAGVATAIAIGGPGSVFWMWVIALLSASSAFVESTLAQLYKQKSNDSFIGGPAYYIKTGLKKEWLGTLFAILIVVTFGFAFVSVQSNTICAAVEHAFGWQSEYMGIIITALTIIIIFGGIQRIARFSDVIVPVMAIGYIILTLVIIALNFRLIPSVFAVIIEDAFTFDSAMGGILGATIMQGIRRGLFSNEAGMGSAPNVAATASVTHPVKQGLIQALGVFTDTLIICSCTAFIILFSGEYISGDYNGVQLTQQALCSEIGSIGSTIIAIAIFIFAFTSIIGNYYYGEVNIRYLNGKKKSVLIYRILVGAMVMFGSVVSLDMVWALADITMALMTICNLIAIFGLGKYAFRLLQDYRSQLKSGIKDPVFRKESMPDIEDDIQCW